MGMHRTVARLAISVALGLLFAGMMWVLGAARKLGETMVFAGVAAAILYIAHPTILRVLGLADEPE
jgi:small-conductance mechanosensitive channel